jgi:cell division protein FtsB
MPPARSSARTARTAPAAPRRHARTPPRPRRLVRRIPPARVRWDRIGRVALLITLAVVALLYVQHALAYLSTRSQAENQRAIVRRLARENAALAAQERSLDQPATIIRDARALGMVRPGERPYVIPGLTGR